MTPSPPHPAYRPPRNYASGAASLSPHRLQRRTPHRRSGQNRPRDHRSSDKIAAAVVPLPPTTPVNASPAQAAASSNPHSHQPPTRRPAGSFLGGFRTPVLRERANSTTGPASETLHPSSPQSDRHPKQIFAANYVALNSERSPIGRSRPQSPSPAFTICSQALVTFSA